MENFYLHCKWELIKKTFCQCVKKLEKENKINGIYSLMNLSVQIRFIGI